MPLVGVVMGSKSDAETLQPALDILKQLGIDHEVSIISAHRTPEKARDYSKGARERGIEVIIAAAGMAAHLPGVIASWTTPPVIGVPLSGSELKGTDALYSIVQMPAGIPVATVGIDNARNAALLAVQMLALCDEALMQKLKEFRQKLADASRQKTAKVREKLRANG